MRGFLIALQFLTVIPVRVKNVNAEAISRSLVYFPVAGLLLGLILSGTSGFLLLLGFERFFIDIILVILLVVLTGGIHLDGLADTADAFLSRKNKDEMLKIMRDSHIGVMGVLSLIIVILLKIVFLSSISASLEAIALVLMCVLSRWALVFSMFLFPYARPEGKARLFIQGANPRVFIFSTAITIACVILFWKVYGLLLFGLTAVFSYAAARFTSNKIGGVTGDTLGAVNELVEVAVLFGICILGRSNLWMIWQ